jgi:hypothetical protein
MEAVFNNSIEPQFHKYFFPMIEDAKNIANENALGLKDFFIGEIERLDQILKETIQKEEEAVKSQEAIDLRIKENKTKAEWLNTFIKELETILEI